jgi:hypothetical protein
VERHFDWACALRSAGDDVLTKNRRPEHIEDQGDDQRDTDAGGCRHLAVDDRHVVGAGMRSLFNNAH